ncbi:D-alanyl-D-alanine dipeptidase [Proteiniborus ethanoligenes]|uniref:D-alanyl-D-alanine dipeptidase n=1 Tax=Proteiniborus ethanoligenes TaxID=415015 RepID=A0A1H3SJQ4_9FIRM|nr:D-alanyl-D-alanine dipeptidase [Proteiniborus ethanoligenes]
MSNLKNLYELVSLESIDSSFIIELRYATQNNFVKKQVYPRNSKAYLQKETALKLKKANAIFKENGFTIKIWDAYRPLYVQKVFWEYVKDSRYVADPKIGSKHNRGASIDITLVDKDGIELEMPTAFDDFTEKASINYLYHTEVARTNVKFMTRVMEDCGFKGISSEWWHFDDVGWQKYPLLDISFEELDINSIGQ